MTRDFERQLDAFSVPETRGRIESYFKKYWLDGAEYLENWLPIQESIFDSQAKHLPDLMFKPNFELLPLAGINIFTSEEDFGLLQSCMKQTGDNYFVIVQNEKVIIEFYDPENGYGVHPFLRFKYPVDISWDEMMSGGYISIELLQGAAKDYFVFGDGGTWGRYVANSYENPSAIPEFSTPLNIMGFKKEYSEIFRTNFEHLIEPEIISRWLPDSYKQLLGTN